jgi:multicomponent Na+:H+ antiporter subunit D
MLFAVFIIGAFMLPIIRFVSDSLMSFAGILTLIIVNIIIWLFAPAVFRGEVIVSWLGGWAPVNGIPIGINIVLDKPALIMAIIFAFLALMAMIHSLSYIKKSKDKISYYMLLLFLTLGIIGMVITGDLFNLYIFMEITALSAYSLTAFMLGKEELEASFKYQVLGTVSSLMILFSIGLVLLSTGHLNIASVASTFIERGMTSVDYVAFGLLLGGFGLKSALVPFHIWLIDAHPAAPSPVSALLSGVVIKAGMFAMVRLIFIMFGFNETVGNILMVVAIASIFVGTLLAVVQDNVKRMLAYSSVAQMGYIALAFSFGTVFGIIGGFFQIITHALAKGALFMSAGSVITATHTKSMKEMGGLFDEMPFSTIGFMIGGLSIVGVPILTGFWSKLTIATAGIHERMFLIVGIIILTSVITLAYYSNAFKMIFLGEKSEHLKKITIKESFIMALPIILLTIVTLVVGIAPEPVIELLQGAADQLINQEQYIQNVLGGI